MRRFEQEAQAAAVLNHPNILAVYQFGDYQGSPYLVPKLLEGETLQTRVGRGPIPLQEPWSMGARMRARRALKTHEIIRILDTAEVATTLVGVRFSRRAVLVVTTLISHWNDVDKIIEMSIPASSR